MSEALYVTRDELDALLEEELAPIREQLASLATHEDIQDAVEHLKTEIGEPANQVLELLQARDADERTAAADRRQTWHLFVDRLTMPLQDPWITRGGIVLGCIVAAGYFGVGVVTDWFSVNTVIEAGVAIEEKAAGDDGAMLPDTAVGGDEGPAFEP